jgi:23S rRNA (adenine2503-C2)-methyltransferase
MARVPFLGIAREALLEAFPKAAPFHLEAAYKAGHLHGHLNQELHIPQSLIQSLQEKYSFSPSLEVASKKISFDGTIKWLLTAIDGGSAVEAVLIPEHSNRNTLCLSSQVGCSLSCKFCHTGTQKFERNLSSHQILSQFIIAAQHLNDYPLWGVKGQGTRKLTSLSNVVFMGQGEPLYNWPQVQQAIKTLTEPALFNMSPSRITVSTSGIVPLIKKVAELGVRLAVSLHAPTDDLRNDIMPINKTYPISTLIEACKEFSALNSLMPRISFEYVMLRGFNDSVGCAKDLIGLLAGMDAHVNLIPFNQWPGAKYLPTLADEIERFKEVLLANHIKCTVRKNRGTDIMAACGQLKSAMKLGSVLEREIKQPKKLNYAFGS